VRALGRDLFRNSEVSRVKDEILQCIETSVGIGTLRHHADALSYGDSIIADIGTRDGRSPRRRTNASGKNSDRRCLSGAIRADHSKEFTFVNDKLERIECDNVSTTGTARIAVHRLRRPSDRFRRRRTVDLSELPSFDCVNYSTSKSFGSMMIPFRLVFERVIERTRGSDAKGVDAVIFPFGPTASLRARRYTFAA